MTQVELREILPNIGHDHALRFRGQIHVDDPNHVRAQRPWRDWFKHLVWRARLRVLAVAGRRPVMGRGHSPTRSSGVVSLPTRAAAALNTETTSRGAAIEPVGHANSS